MKSQRKGNNIVLVIPDTHAPFHHRDSLDFLRDLKREYKPSRIVHIGDEIDNHAISFHDSDPNGLGAGDEYEAAMKYMKQLYKLFPKVDACTSNHTSLPYRKAFKHGIPSQFIRGYADFMQAPKGWRWSDEILIDKVRYFHGVGYSGALGHLQAAQAYRVSTVMGHLHSFAGVSYSASPFDLIFGMNVGCLIDVKAYAFSYGKDFKHKPVLGAGIVIEGTKAIFVPMFRGGR